MARLSTGVVSLEPDLRIRTANHAAGAILGVDLETHVGESIVTLAANRPMLAQFVRCGPGAPAARRPEWREQIMLRGEGGRRVLMCACTELPGDTDSPNGYVIVFDDITTLLQAQRDAAWGEVARRLAHEIKNPLTPIQLSAERLRRKYLKPEAGEGELLDRATHTIIQQVEAMKQMVNAFSEYARTPTMEVSRFDLNALITELSRALRASREAVGDRTLVELGFAADRGGRRAFAAGAAQLTPQRDRSYGASSRSARRDVDAALDQPGSRSRRDQSR